MNAPRQAPVTCPDLPSELSADDVLAVALSMIKGRVFGPISTEVKFIRLSLEKSGFEIRRKP